MCMLYQHNLYTGNIHTTRYRAKNGVQNFLSGGKNFLSGGKNFLSGGKFFLSGGKFFERKCLIFVEISTVTAILGFS